MSYHIVQKVEADIENNKLFITGADNNVWPRTPEKWECSYCEKWQDNGFPSMEICILDGYEAGNFQAGRENKFTKALEVLRKMPEYQEFDWRGNNWDLSSENRKERQAELYEMMSKALMIKLPPKQFAIIKDIAGRTGYFRHRKGSGHCNWYYEKEKASLFRYLEDAEFQKKCFTNSEDWQTIKI